jgi:serine/threonine-protein kinase RsbW
MTTNDYTVLCEGAPAEGPRERPGLDRYREVRLRRPEEMIPILDDVVASLVNLGYPPRDRAGVRLALEEAILNALRHGNQGDPGKRVWVRYHLCPTALVAEVEDEGAGFDPDSVPDPTLPENLGRPCGRGLLLMRHYMTQVCFCGRGNRVVLCKQRPV